MKIKISSILIFISLIPLMIGDGIQYILKISSRNLAMLIAIEACIYFSIFLYSFCKRKTNWCINCFDIHNDIYIGRITSCSK